MICLKLIKRQLAANAAHAAIDHYVGDETDSPAEQSENMPEERERRFWVRFFLKVMNKKIYLYRVHWPMLLEALPEASLVTKMKTGTVHMQQCLKNDKDDFG